MVLAVQEAAAKGGACDGLLQLGGSANFLRLVIFQEKIPQGRFPDRGKSFFMTDAMAGEIGLPLLARARSIARY